MTTLTLTNSIDALLSASPTGDYKSVFSTFSPTDATSVYNTNLWGGGGHTLDWTGICWHDDGDILPRGVAITKRHVLMADHAGHVPGNHGTWIKADGSLVTRTFSSWVANIGNDDNVSGMRVLYLDSDLPSGVAIYPIYAGPQQARPAGMAVIKIDQEHKALVGEYTTNSPYAGFFTVTIPPDPVRSTYYEDTISGDSGKPFFVLSGLQLYYATSAVYGGGGSGPDPYPLINLISTACATLDAAGAQTGYVPTFFAPEPQPRSFDMSVAYKNSWTARQHDLPALAATTAAAILTKLNKGIVFMADGALDIVDSNGTKKTITLPAGSVYPVQNYGVVTGGGTTLTQNQFATLFD